MTAGNGWTLRNSAPSSASVCPWHLVLAAPDRSTAGRLLAKAVIAVRDTSAIAITAAAPDDRWPESRTTIA